MECNRAKELVHNYLDDDITAKEQTMLFEHLNSCADCSEFYKRLKHQQELLGELQPKVGRIDMLSVIRGAKEKKRARTRKAIAIAIPCATAVAASLFIVVPMLLFGSGLGKKAEAPSFYAEEAAEVAYEATCEEVYEEAVEEACEEVCEATAEEALPMEYYDEATAHEDDYITFGGEPTDEKLEEADEKFKAEKENVQIIRGEENLLYIYIDESAVDVLGVKFVSIDENGNELNEAVTSEPEAWLECSGYAIIDISDIEAGKWSVLLQTVDFAGEYTNYYFRAEITG